MQYESVIGLEVHLQLSTQTKMFCSCKNEFAARPNSLTCPVCLGLPGSLPVINEEAIRSSIKVALSLNCTIANLVKFDRKNYYYPDLPKNYQISQYDMPLSYNGSLVLKTNNFNKRIRIRRVHLEEDAGKLIHEEDYSLIDYNRSGTPLLEIVTEPDINSPDEAYEYLVSLKTLLKYLDVSNCDMEKGSLRCDANISLRRKNSLALGIKIELKNMNSFRAVKRALEDEVRRQTDLLDEGKTLVQETRLWDEEEKKTRAMRSKEEASDYRYFPEPDLVPFRIEKSEIHSIKAELPELPQERKKRFKREFSLKDEEAQFLISDLDCALFFENCFKLYKEARLILNWIKGPIAYEKDKRGKDIKCLSINPNDLVSLIKLVEAGKISNLSAKKVLSKMLDTSKTAEEIIRLENLSQVSSESDLLKIVQSVIDKNKKTVTEYLSGKSNAIMFLVGQVMKESQGRANPKKAKELLEKKIERGS